MAEPRFPDALGRDIPTATRTLVETRDGEICRYCGQPSTTIDHVFPWIQGGTHADTNLVCCCSVCNSIAGPRVFSEFSAKHAYVVARRGQLGATRLRRLEVLAAAGRPIEEWT